MAEAARFREEARQEFPTLEADGTILEIASALKLAYEHAGLSLAGVQAEIENGEWPNPTCTILTPSNPTTAPRRSSTAMTRIRQL